MKSTREISKIKTEFSLQNGTSVAGGKAFLEYLERIRLTEAFAKLSGLKQSNSVFSLPRILLYFIIGWMLGCQRLFHFRSLQKDHLIQRFLGGRCPHHSLLNKELLRLGKSKSAVVTELKQLNMNIISPCLPDSLILDLDSTVETVYGHQKGAAVGVNSHKRGRKSYHPLLVYEGKSRLCLNAVLRPGNTHSSHDVVGFMNQTLELLGDRSARYARFDKGFGGEAFYSLLESKNIGYVGKLKWTERLQKEVSECRYWKRYVDENWVIEGIVLFYQATSWDKLRRVVVIRKAQRCEGDQLLMEQPELMELYWQYEAMVTTESWESVDVWRFYNQRCCMENYIKEAKHGFAIDRISTGNFDANEVDLTLKLLTYNLFERFKRDCCESIHVGYTINRFRREFVACVGVIVQHSRQTILKLAQEFHGKRPLERMLRKVATLE
ncbi:IS1380 family transposase [Paenibacillus alginolyticus]|uniref:IS1380 family transposase n=1 Tax=Paenibacillus alginolyticus TaxID=59839 RepID=UPI0003FCB4FC|nr:IS1380 family transposase [Paenibacillus alginolyticus]MCY9669932.1 IS1380 family transposase [Paenibacillus alginolyticus]